METCFSLIFIFLIFFFPPLPYFPFSVRPSPSKSTRVYLISYCLTLSRGSSVIASHCSLPPSHHHPTAIATLVAPRVLTSPLFLSLNLCDATEISLSLYAPKPKTLQSKFRGKKFGLYSSVETVNFLSMIKIYIKIEN